jgi:hypothetical protein
MINQFALGMIEGLRIALPSCLPDHRKRIQGLIQGLEDMQNDKTT